MAYDKYESAANITFSIGENEIPIQSIDTTKDVEIEEIRGNSLKPIGYSVTEIAFSGSVTFDGNGVIDDSDIDADDLEDFFTDDEGVPVAGATITIAHENNDRQTAYEDVMVTSDGYETTTGDVSGVTFDWIASDRTKSNIS